MALTNPFTLAAKDTTLLTVPLTFKWSGVASAARSVLGYGAVNYGINGRFTINTPLGTRSRFRSRGRERAPAQALTRGPRRFAN
ncbi:MAG: hypothetical protein IPL76_00350 [Gemmatimonadetes bacterium]|nr:hypothetical protein [Gemmatimonadota bacterium]